jgi:nucleoside-diphosphate-sugar epimerase
VREPVHADDLAVACVAVLDRPSTFNRAYNLSGGSTLTYLEMVEHIFASLGKRPRILRVPLPLLRAGLAALSLLPAYRFLSADMADRLNEHLCFDHHDAERDFGYAPRGFLT